MTTHPKWRVFRLETEKFLHNFNGLYLLGKITATGNDLLSATYISSIE
jgi:hypothetical protein